MTNSHLSSDNRVRRGRVPPPSSRGRACSSVTNDSSSDVVLQSEQESTLTKSKAFDLVGGKRTRAFDSQYDLQIYAINTEDYYKNYKKFIKNKCVRLDTLNPVLRQLARGQQRRLLTLIIGEIKNWELTWYNNSNQDYRSFLKVIKNNKLTEESMTKCLTLPWVKEGNFQSQMMSSFSKISRTTENVTTFFDKDLPRVMETLDKANKSCDTVNDFFEKLKDLLCGENSNRFIFDIANKIYLLASAIYHRAPLDLLISSILNLTSGLVLDVVVSKLLTTLKSCPTRDVEGNFNFESQSDIPDGEEVSFMSAICSGIVGSITGLFGPIHKEAFAKYTINLKKITALTLLLRSCGTILSYFAVLFNFGLNLCMKFVRKYVGKLPKCLQPDTLTDIYEDLEYIEGNNIIETSKINMSSAKCIIEFRNKLNNVLKNTKDINVNRASMLYLNHIKREAELWYKEIPPYLRDVPGSDRSRPAWVYIYGEPRIGKTAVVAKMIIHSCAKSMHLINDNEKWDAFVYSRNLGEPYWEGYNSHPVVSYTDILQEIKDEQKLDLAITELGRINDSNCYSLPMAFDGPKGKGKNFFTSRLIVSDAQGNFGDTVLDQRCWSRGIHIQGRRTVVVEVELNSIYKGVGGVGINYEAYNKAYEVGNFIGTREIPVAPADAYIVTIRDNLTHLPVARFTNLLSAIDYITEKCVIFDSKEHNQIDAITEFCKRQYSCKPQTNNGNGVNDSILEMKTFKSQMDTGDDEIFLSPCASPQKNRIIRRTPEVCSCYDPSITNLLFEIHEVPHKCYNNFEDVNNYVNDYVANKGKFTGKLKNLKTILKNHIDSYAKWFANIKHKMKTKWNQFCEDHPIWSTVVRTASMISIIVVSMQITVKGYSWLQSRCQNSDVTIDDISDINEKSLVSQTHEMNEAKQKQKPKVRVRKIHDDNKNKVEFGKSTMTSNAGINIGSKDTSHILINALCRLYARSSERYGCTELMTDTGFNVVANTFVITYHFWQRLKQYRKVDPMFTLSLEWCSKNQTNRIDLDIDSIQEFPREQMWNHAEDIVYITIPGIGLGRDLRTHFSSVNDNPDLTHSYLFGLRSAKHICKPDCNLVQKVRNGVIETIDLTKTRMLGFDGPVSNLTYDTQPQYIGTNKVPGFTTLCTQYILYGGGKTSGGDCMMLVQHQDPRYVGKIIGVHTAGDPKHDYGAGSIIFKEDLDDVIRYNDSIIKPCEFKYITTEVPLTGFGAQASCLDVMPLGKPTTFEKNGKLTNFKVNIPSKTKISPSIFYDLMENDLGPAKTKPAALRKVTINGVEKSPMLLGLDKLTRVSPPIPNKMYKLIKEHIANSICSWQSVWLSSDKYILSDFQAMNGIEGLKGMDVSTSAGFPWCRLASVSNKKPWLDEYEGEDGKKLYNLKPELQEAIKDRINKAKLNIIKETYFIDTLKDETRPIEKVNACKTRIFQVGPFDLSLTVRKYFGLFIAHMQNTFLVGESAVGINPDSYDWTLFLKRLDEVDGMYMCGDFRFWDASIPFQVVDLFVYCANRFYDDGLMNARIRFVLVATIMSSDHFVDNLAFSVRQGNTSGNTLTTLINNVWNMATIRYVYLKTVENDFINYDKCIRSGIYGDDNLHKVGGIAFGRLTMRTMQKHLKNIGLEYTSADKSDLLDDYLPLSKVTFLKRNFVKDSTYNFYLAPLDYDVITEIARWSESNPFNVVDQMARFNQTLMFASSHGVKVFNKFKKLFTRYCDAVLKGDLIDHDGRVLILDYNANQLFTFERCKQIFYPTHYGLPCELGSLSPGTREAIAAAMCEL